MEKHTGIKNKMVLLVQDTILSTGVGWKPKAEKTCYSIT